MLKYLYLVSAITALCSDDYESSSRISHEPLSLGPLRLSYARPAADCRSISSKMVEDTISHVKASLRSPDLARIFENSYPNALDTAMQFHHPDSSVKVDLNLIPLHSAAQQLRPYRRLIADDPVIANLYRGIIKTQVYQLSDSFKCRQENSGGDSSQSMLQEQSLCQISIEDLAYFLQISADYLQYAIDPLFFDDIKWLDSVNQVLDIVENNAKDFPCVEAKTQAHGCASKSVKLVAFPLPARPSNSTTVYPYVIPSNAFLSAQLSRAADIASSLIKGESATERLRSLAAGIKNGIDSFGKASNGKFGQVYAYETDGQGNHVFFDDARFPNLLALPSIGFASIQDATYLNTRRMILSSEGNPDHYAGKQISGIGSFSTGRGRVWPLSLLFAIQTTTDPQEVLRLLNVVGNSTAGTGLIHESIDINDANVYSRPWYPIANSWFGDTLLDVLTRFPKLLEL